MKNRRLCPPSFWQRASATWIDFVLLLGLYLILGYISEHLFQRDAYPPATGMQLYSERDFVVYWFFVQWILIFSACYLFICYKFFEGTLGQKLTRIQLIAISGEDLATSHIIKRIVVVLLTLLFILLPGPIIALLFFALGAAIFNAALSVVFLLFVVLGSLYVSLTRYERGATSSYKDKLSQTRLILVKE